MTDAYPRLANETADEMKRSSVDSYGVQWMIVGRSYAPRGRYTSAESEIPSRIGTRRSWSRRTS